MITSEEMLPRLEALALLREQAVRNGHEMMPASWDLKRGVLVSVCGRGCGTVVSALLDGGTVRRGGGAPVAAAFCAVRRGGHIAPSCQREEPR